MTARRSGSRPRESRRAPRRLRRRVVLTAWGTPWHSFIYVRFEAWRSHRRLVESSRPLEPKVVVAPPMQVHDAVLDGTLPRLVEVGVVCRWRSVAHLVNLVFRDDVRRPALHDRHVHLRLPA